MTVAVWVGYQLPRSMKYTYGGKPVYGGTYPADIFKKFVEEALPIISREAFDRAHHISQASLLASTETPVQTIPISDLPNYGTPATTTSPSTTAPTGTTGTTGTQTGATTTTNAPTTPTQPVPTVPVAALPPLSADADARRSGFPRRCSASQLDRPRDADADRVDEHPRWLLSRPRQDLDRPDVETVPFSSSPMPSACVSLPGPEQSSSMAKRPRRSRISSMPSVGSSARISAAAPTPSGSATAFSSAWMP